jgi:hypothetical protein
MAPQTIVDSIKIPGARCHAEQDTTDALLPAGRSLFEF